MAELTLVEAVNDALHTELERDADVMVLGEDVGRAGGVFRATAGLRDRFGPTAASTHRSPGRAPRRRRRPVHGRLETGRRMQYDAFSYPCLDQLITHVGRYRWRSGGRMEFPITVRMPYGGASARPSCTTISPEAYYVHTGIKVAIPRRRPTPRVCSPLRSATRSGRDLRAEARVPHGARRGAGGRLRRAARSGAHSRARGRTVTLISYGAMVHVCERAAAALDVSCEVVDIRSLRPLDEQAILASVAKTGRVVIVHEAPAPRVRRRARRPDRRARDLRSDGRWFASTGYDVPYPYWSIEDAYMPSVERVSAAVRSLLAA